MFLIACFWCKNYPLSIAGATTKHDWRAKEDNAKNVRKAGKNWMTRCPVTIESKLWKILRKNPTTACTFS